MRASQTQTALLACLHDEMGRVVRAESLCAVLGHNGRNRRKELHILRQYMAWVRQTLSAHKLPYVLTVAPDLGYALCEIRRRRGGKNGH